MGGAVDIAHDGQILDDGTTADMTERGGALRRGLVDIDGEGPEVAVERTGERKSLRTSGDRNRIRAVVPGVTELEETISIGLATCNAAGESCPVGGGVEDVRVVASA